MDKHISSRLIFFFFSSAALYHVVSCTPEFRYIQTHRNSPVVASVGTRAHPFELKFTCQCLFNVRSFALCLCLSFLFFFLFDVYTYIFFLWFNRHSLDTFYCMCFISSGRVLTQQLYVLFSFQVWLPFRSFISIYLSRYKCLTLFDRSRTSAIFLFVEIKIYSNSLVSAWIMRFFFPFYLMTIK